MADKQYVLDLAYAHANMRLRTRFDFEISKQHWLDLSQQFKSKAKEQKQNHLGDIEGWLQIGPNNTWICCYYSCKAKCIKTFYKNPPAFVIDDTKKIIEQEAKKKAKEILANAYAKAEQLTIKAEQDKITAPDNAFIDLKNKDNIIKWIKEQLRSAHYIAQNGYQDVAINLIGKLANMPACSSIEEAEKYLQGNQA